MTDQLSLFQAPAALDPAEEAAKSLIRHEVLRGDNEKWIRDGAMGHFGCDYTASVGGYDMSQPRESRTWYSTHHIIVDEVDEQPTFRVFKLKDIIQKIRAEADEQGIECNPEKPLDPTDDSPDDE